VAFARWLSICTGKAYRLPSEAEWEKAARGTDGRLYPWGDAWDPSRCNAKESGIGDTTSVVAYANGASPYGVLDMSGNVFEWTLSLWGTDMKEPEFRYPYDPQDGREDQLAQTAVLRVLRGGGFYYSATYARASCRLRSYPDYRVRTRGFRLANGRV
jgi:formylglycine-generating enzyme required for sulfatase activity